MGWIPWRPGRTVASIDAFAVPADVPIEFDEFSVARIRGTRVTLDTVVTAFRLGATPEEIVPQYPTLELADVYSIIAFLLRQTATVDTYLREYEAGVERSVGRTRSDGVRRASGSGSSLARPRPRDRDPPRRRRENRPASRIE